MKYFLRSDQLIQLRCELKSIILSCLLLIDFSPFPVPPNTLSLQLFARAVYGPVNFSCHQGSGEINGIGLENVWTRNKTDLSLP